MWAPQSRGEHTPHADAGLLQVCNVVARVLGVDLVHIVGVSDDGALYRRSGVGWTDSIFDDLGAHGEDGSLVAAALTSQEPLIADDLLSGEGFLRTRTLTDHGVTGGVAARIRRGTAPVGVLAAYATDGRRFSANAAACLQGMADLLGAALGQQQAVAEAQRVRRIDDLTGLPNRQEFLERLDQAIERATGRRVAVLLADFDRFKIINDGLGHAAGDALLEAFAGRLRNAVRPGDVVARFGADEFAVLCEDCTDEEATSVAQWILSAVEGPFSLHGAETYASVSIGISSASTAEAKAGELISWADTAMYRAKDAGRGRIEWYAPVTRRQAVRRHQLGNGLRRALDRRELDVVYQPQVDLSTGALLGLEALLRWTHPHHGIVEPSEFIAIAQDNGAIVRLGEWVLDRACANAVEWAALHPDGTAPTVAVNLTGLQVAQGDLVARTAAALERTGLPADRLIYEITESGLIGDPASAATTLADLKALGVTIAMDDFGTGYSSLSHLRDFPVDLVKIDRSFVGGVSDDLQDRTLVEATIALAHALGLATVAEGVETSAQRDELHALGCDYGQGHVWSKPLDELSMGAWLEAHHRSA